MAKRKKKKKLKIKWNRIFIALVVIGALSFGIYKSLHFAYEKAVSFIDNLFGEEEPIKEINHDDDIATVIIDPGHGGPDAGTSKGDLLEKDITLQTSLYLQEELEELNIHAVLTRTEDTNLDNNKIKDLDLRAQMSAEYDATYFVSIHVNAFEGKSNIYGFEAYIEDDESRALAESILNQLDETEISMTRGIIEGHRLQVLRNNTVPSTLIELGYINSQDYDYLSQDDQRLIIAKAIAKGIANQITQ